MRTPEQVKWDYIQEWLKKADQDLRAARVLARAESKDEEVIAFHCQQSIEKLIKTVLIYHQIEFGKTHDIETIRTLLESTNPALAKRLSIADWLSPMAVEYRYPGIYEEISQEQTQKLIPTAEKVKKIVIEVLAPYLKSGRPSE